MIDQVTVMKHKYFLKLVYFKFTFLIILIFFTIIVNAAANKTCGDDSIIVTVHPAYDLHRKTCNRLSCTNYRKILAAPIRLPVWRLSEMVGGLTAEREVDLMQSKSLRLKDNFGKEWILHRVEKTPNKLLPENLRQTLVTDRFDDALDNQHPFSALIIPPLAEAARIPHANPIIGFVVADKNLGPYSAEFQNTVCLLEEVEPSDRYKDTTSMTNNLVDRNENRFNADQYLRAYMLNLLIGDWDRYDDQKRWTNEPKGNAKVYTDVPRNPNHVFRHQKSVSPSITVLPYKSPLLANFRRLIPKIKPNLAKTRFVAPYPNFQMTHKHWKKVVNDFLAVENDSVLEGAIKRLPGITFTVGHDELLAKLKSRRAALPGAMEKYYRILH